MTWAFPGHFFVLQTMPDNLSDLNKMLCMTLFRNNFFCSNQSLLELMENRSFIISSFFYVLKKEDFRRFFPYPKSFNQAQNKVIFNKLECFNCNWHCSIIKNKELTYPCINQISSSDVISQIIIELNKKNYL